MINYKAIPSFNGRYRYQRKPLSTPNSSSVAFTASGTQELIWRIPANQNFNLSRFRIEGFLNFGREVDKLVWVHENPASFIDRIMLTDGSGNNLIDLANANNYVAALGPALTTFGDLEVADSTSGLYMSESRATNLFPANVVMPAGYNAYGVTPSSTQVTSITQPDIQYSRVGVKGIAGAGGAGALSVKRSIPLSIFKETILAVDKDYISPVELQLSVWLAPSAKIGYMDVDTANAPTTFVAQPTLTDVYLYMAIQQDATLDAYTRQKYETTGIQFMYPHVQSFRIPSSASAPGTVTPMSFTVSMPPTYGKLLKRIVYAPFNAIETGPTAFDHSNMGGAKMFSYNTSLDSKKLQNDVISSTQTAQDDYRENRPILHGSAIRNSASYYYNWLHIDSFCNPKHDITVPDDNVLEGVPMTEGGMPVTRQWVFEGGAAQNLVNHAWATFLRGVVFKKGQPFVEIMTTW